MLGSVHLGPKPSREQVGSDLHSGGQDFQFAVVKCLFAWLWTWPVPPNNICNVMAGVLGQSVPCGKTTLE